MLLSFIIFFIAFLVASFRVKPYDVEVVFIKLEFRETMLFQFAISVVEFSIYFISILGNFIVLKNDANSFIQFFSSMLSSSSFKFNINFLIIGFFNSLILFFLISLFFLYYIYVILSLFHLYFLDLLYNFLIKMIKLHLLRHL